MKEEKERFASFLIRVKRKKNVWLCSINYVQTGEEMKTSSIEKIPEIIKKLLKKGGNYEKKNH